MVGCHDIQHNDTKHDDIQYSNKSNVTLSLITFIKMSEHIYGECYLCYATYKAATAW
jgi:hypothetical protein